LNASALKSMLQARSVAVVGASVRPGSVGTEMIRQLEMGRFQGNIAPVNPKYERISDRKCFASLHDVPFDIDLALLGVPTAALEEQMFEVTKLAIPAVVIFASGHDAADSTLSERLRQVALDNNLTVCGGNCMGFVNFEHGLRALAFEEPADLKPGPIAWITHSGSAFSALLHNRRGLRFSVAVSAGAEFTTTVADYVSFALDETDTRVVALFLETVRDPTGFLEALERAAALDIPVVALKVGNQPTSRDMVVAHSGTLAGDDAAYEAVFDRYGVTRVRTLAEMVETLELVTSGRRSRPGGLATVHDSGGERAHLIDVAADVKLKLASISEPTRRRLERVLEPGLPAVNPLDAWGTGNDFETIFFDCMQTLAEDPDTGALALVVDLAGEDLETGYARVAERFYSQTEIPFAVLANLPTAVDPDASARLRAQGIPVLEATATGLEAFRHLFQMRDFRALPPLDVPEPIPEHLREEWRGRLSRPEAISADEGFRLLDDYGIPSARTVLAQSDGEAIRAAEDIGYPVVLKTAEGLAHKSDAGAVLLRIIDEEGVQAAYRSLAERFGRRIIVQEMVPAGVELALGIVRDAQFGPLVMIAGGGVLVELLNDSRFALPPLDELRSRRLIDRLAGRVLLDGYRGAARADLGAVAKVLTRLSVLALDLGESLEALDVNPLIAGPDGCVAADCLVVPRSVRATR
jgi:acetate---CoA ligase (ADP-forming)